MFASLRISIELTSTDSYISEERGAGGDRETERQTERQRETERVRERQKETERDREIERRDIDREIERRDRDRETERDRERPREMQGKTWKEGKQQISQQTPPLRRSSAMGRAKMARPQPIMWELKDRSMELVDCHMNRSMMASSKADSGQECRSPVSL